MSYEEDNKFAPGTLIRGEIQGKEVVMVKLSTSLNHNIQNDYWVNLHTGVIWHCSWIKGKIYEIDPFGK